MRYTCEPKKSGIQGQGHVTFEVAKMAEEIGFENRHFRNFKGHVTLTLTLGANFFQCYTVYSSTSTYIPNFIQIGTTFCGRTDEQTDGRTYVLESTCDVQWSCDVRKYGMYL